MIGNYLKLEWIRLTRWFRERQLHPTVGVILSVLLFIATISLAYFKSKYAPALITGVGIYTSFSFRSAAHTRFIKKIYGSAMAYKIQLAEGFLISIPFALPLLVMTDYWFAAVVILGSIAAGLFSGNIFSIKSYSTPFSKDPFEYAVGTRRYWPLLLATHALLILSLFVGNFNLGLFTIVAVALISMSYYGDLEHIGYVSMHIRDSRDFLIRKIQVSFKHYIFMISIPTFVMAVVYRESLILILALATLGFMWSVLMICIKYGSLPNVINITDSILLAISLLAPPLLILTLPYYYSRSIGKLKTVLG